MKKTIFAKQSISRERQFIQRNSDLPLQLAGSQIDVKLPGQLVDRPLKFNTLSATNGYTASVEIIKSIRASAVLPFNQQSPTSTLVISQNEIEPTQNLDLPLLEVPLTAFRPSNLTFNSR